MDEIYGGGGGSGVNSTSDYADKALMSPENMMLSTDHQYYMSYDHYGYYHHNFPGSENNILGNNGFQTTLTSEAASMNNNPEIQRGRDDQEGYSLMKAKIVSHPSFDKLLDAYIDCQKVGAPPEISRLLDEIRRESNLCKQNGVTTCFGADPELDEFMESFCDILVKYKSDLSKPFHEATTFLNKIEEQLGNLCKDDGGDLSSEEEFSGREIEVVEMKSDDQQLKDSLLRKYGSHIGTLKLEFSKKKKKGKLPKDARQTLLEWWNVHYKWPYPTEADKILLAELTGLDQKQINNWFINQRKRHWRPSENMQLAVMDNLSG